MPMSGLGGLADEVSDLGPQECLSSDRFHGVRERRPE